MNDGTTALPVSPVQTEEETMKLATFFHSLAEKVVQASTLPKQLEQTQRELDGLKHDFEAERTHSTMLDQQLLDMRNQRNAAEDELAKVRQELEETKRAYSQQVSEANHIRGVLDQLRETHARVIHERDDYGMRAMQLEDDLAKAKATLTKVKEHIRALMPDPEPEPERQPEPQPAPYSEPKPPQTEPVQEPHPVQQAGDSPAQPPAEDHQDSPPNADSPSYAQVPSNRW